MSQPWIPMPPKIPLQNPSVCGPIKHRSPAFQFTHPSGCFLRVQLGHSPIIDVLSAAHRIREMNPPVIAIVDISQRGRDPAFRHHRMRLTEQRLTNQPYLNTGCRSLDRRTQPRAARTDHEHIVFKRFVVTHLIRTADFSPQRHKEHQGMRSTLYADFDLKCEYRGSDKTIVTHSAVSFLPRSEVTPNRNLRNLCNLRIVSLCVLCVFVVNSKNLRFRRSSSRARSPLNKGEHKGRGSRPRTSS